MSGADRKKALITGASRGIGRSVASALASSGFDLYLTCRNNRELLDSLAEELRRSYGIQCYCYAFSICDEDKVSEMFRDIPYLDVLVNNAGISYTGLLTEMSFAQWKEVIDTNLSSCFLTCKYAVPEMIRRKKGRIINISSVWGNVGASMEVAYSASKGGVNAFTKALAKELAPSNIQVNAIACGLIADIQPPDYETRNAILRKKAERDNLEVPNDVMAYIAKNIVSNIRELEGALNRIVAYAKLTNQDISIALAENSLKDIFSENASAPLTTDLIQEIVANHFNIRVEDIQGSKKPKNIAFPRQISMYLCRKLLDISLPKIGESFGGRDHTTVIHAISKIEKQMEADPALQKTLLQLEKEIKGQ